MVPWSPGSDHAVERNKSRGRLQPQTRRQAVPHHRHRAARQPRSHSTPQSHCRKQMSPRMPDSEPRRRAHYPGKDNNRDHRQARPLRSASQLRLAMAALPDVATLAPTHWSAHSVAGADLHSVSNHSLFESRVSNAASQHSTCDDGRLGRPAKAKRGGISPPPTSSHPRHLISHTRLPQRMA